MNKYKIVFTVTNKTGIYENLSEIVTANNEDDAVHIINKKYLCDNDTTIKFTNINKEMT
jgi:hypothetical protein